MQLRNPTKAEKLAYKEKMQHGQGFDLEPKSDKEIQSQKLNSISKEFDEESRLSGSQNQQYFKDEKSLGSPANHDDYGEESFP